MSNNLINFEKFKTGIDWIDSQHDELIKMTLELINAIGLGSGERKIRGMLKFLDRYVSIHFSLENDLMKKLEYPDMMSHLAEHKSFIFTLNNMKKEFSSTGSSIYLLGNVKRHLLDWLVNHIGETDKGFAGFLIEQGFDREIPQMDSVSSSSLDLQVDAESSLDLQVDAESSLDLQVDAESSLDLQMDAESSLDLQVSAEKKYS